MDNKNELKDFMKKKNAEARGEIQIEEENGEGDTLKDRPKPVNQEAGESDTRAAKALSTIRLIMNLIIIIPIALAFIGLIAYVLLKSLPATLYFIKELFFRIISSSM